MVKKLPSTTVVASIASTEFARVLVFFFITSVTCSTFSYAQLQLLKDVDQSEENAYNEYSSLTHGSGRMYYLVNGNELWKSNGTPESTIKLREFKSASNLKMAGTTLYFTADDGLSGPELWKSNGTVGTTVRVKDIMPGPTGSTPSQLTSVGTILFFSAFNSSSGRELYKSDGTSAGTVIVKDLAQGSSNPKNMVAANGLLFFSATNNINGYELWKSDGTAANTVLIRDINGGKNSSDPQSLTYFNNKVYFSAYEASQGRELWSSDGTTSGTTRLKDIRPGTQSSTPRNLIAIGSRLFFTAHDGVHGDELWKSDGSATGTTLVKDMNPGGAGSNATNYLKTPMRDFTNINGQLYFVAAKGATEYVYRSDGTAAGTIIIQKARIQSENVYQPEFTYMNGYVYFFNGGYYEEDQDLIRMPYKGSPSEASSVKRLGIPYSFGSHVPLRNEMIHFYNNVYFFGRFSFSDDQYGGFEFIKSNGTTEGTISVHDSFITTYESRPREMIKGNTLIYMNQYSVLSYTPELYRTDGTPAGTFEVMPGRYHLGWGIVGDRLYFIMEGNGNDGWQLMKTDGTPATTQVVATGVDMYGTSVPKNLTGIGNLLYYSNELDELWKTNGTPEGTEVVMRNSSVLHISPTGMILTSTNGNLDLWKTTAAGLTLVKDFGTASTGTTTTSVGNRFYFSVATSADTDVQIWSSDGTAAGTYMMGGPSLYDVWNRRSVQHMIAFNNQVYFFSGNTYGATSLFHVNGRTSIDEIAELPIPIETEMTSTRMIFFASSGNSLDVYSSDGKSFEGTSHLGTMEMGDMMPYWFQAEAVGDYVYFNSLYHEPMWRTDGTTCGTYPINLGTTENYAIESLGNDLIFGGYMLKTGAEPYVYHNVNSVKGTPACDQTASVVAMNSLKSEEKQDLAYPNPFSATFTLDVVSERNEDVEVAVYTMYGLPVETFPNIQSNTKIEMGASWPKGNYIIKIRTSSGVITQQLIKK